MTPSSNTSSSSMTYKESLPIVPTTSPTSHSLSNSALEKNHNDIKALTDITDKYHSDMKTMNYNITTHHSDMKTMNENIDDMLQNLATTNSKTDKYEEQLTEISSKLSKYEDRLEKLGIKDTQIQPLSLHITKLIDIVPLSS